MKLLCHAKTGCSLSASKSECSFAERSERSEWGELDALRLRPGLALNLVCQNIILFKMK